jgi:hypothetical protein
VRIDPGLVPFIRETAPGQFADSMRRRNQVQAFLDSVLANTPRRSSVEVVDPRDSRRRGRSRHAGAGDRPRERSGMLPGVAFHGFVSMNVPIAHRAINEQFTALRAALHPVTGC